MLQFIADDEGEPLVIPATVDYGASYDALMTAGDYRYPDPDLTAERFFVRGSGARTLFFRILEVPEGAKAASEAVLASIAEHAVRGATFLELLTVGAACPQLPVRGDLAAFGAVREIGRSEPRNYVPVIQRYNGRRYLDPHRVDFPWKPGDQFLVAPLDPAGAP